MVYLFNQKVLPINEKVVLILKYAVYLCSRQSQGTAYYNLIQKIELISLAKL